MTDEKREKKPEAGSEDEKEEREDARPAGRKEMADWVEKDMSAMPDDFSITLKDGTVVTAEQLKKHF